jgi:predicted small lipoprotein YifL
MDRPSGDAALAAATRIVLLLAALSLAGCGVKGAMEPPPGGVQARQAAEAEKAGQKIDTTQPLKPDRSLWIDKLI